LVAKPVNGSQVAPLDKGLKIVQQQSSGVPNWGERPMLTFHVDCGDGWYRAVCPELRVYGAGQSLEDAKRSLFEAARVTAKYVLGLNGKAHADGRLPYAEIVVRNWSNVAVVFQEATAQPASVDH
jgi:hypothetical protein